MSTAAPPVLADGAPQTQELDALRQQLADLQVTLSEGLSLLSHCSTVSAAVLCMCWWD